MGMTPYEFISGEEKALWLGVNIRIRPEFLKMLAELMGTYQIGKEHFFDELLFVFFASRAEDVSKMEEKIINMVSRLREAQANAEIERHAKPSGLLLPKVGVAGE